MPYNYITENNLEHSQNYMYSSYGGMDFLSAYLESRKPFLVKNEADLSKLIFSALQSIGKKPSGTAADLAAICQDFSQSSMQLNRSKIDWYLQRFEVRKRLFSEYDRQTGKPIEQSGYEELSNYMLLSAISGKAYDLFRSLKYLNTFLKLNDTLVSLSTDMTCEQHSLLQALVTSEVQYVMELADRKRIVLEGGTL